MAMEITEFELATLGRSLGVDTEARTTARNPAMHFGRCFLSASRGRTRSPNSSAVKATTLPSWSASRCTSMTSRKS